MTTTPPTLAQVLREVAECVHYLPFTDQADAKRTRGALLERAAALEALIGTQEEK
jgi:hypothetical protein